MKLLLRTRPAYGKTGAIAVRDTCLAIFGGAILEAWQPATLP